MYIKYSDKIESNKRKIIYNKKKVNLNDDNNNYFLNGEDLELPNFRKNNYQSQFIHRKLFSTNSKKKKNKYINFIEHYKNEKNKIKENNYYSNNSNMSKNIENYLNNDSLAENFENLKLMNSNINDILSNMKKEIQLSSNKKEEEVQKIDEDNNSEKFPYMNYNDNGLYNMNKNINELDNDPNVKNNINNSEKINEILINDNNRINNILKKIFIIDKNEQNQINIKGLKQQKDFVNIEFNEFNKEQEQKLNSIYKNNKNKIVNVDKLISDLYEYKIKYEKLKYILNSKNIEKIKKETNDNLSKSKEENNKLNLQKKFLINELTKSIYNNENLRQKYKNQLNRFESYINKMKYELKENNTINNQF